MAHFGVLSYKGMGHLNPMIALSRQLVARGHRVTFFQTSELEQVVRSHGLEFFAIDVCNDRSKAQRRGRRNDNLISRLFELRDRVGRIADDMEEFLRALPPAIQSSDVDALIVSEISLAGPTLSELLCLPYFIISTSIPHNFGWSVAPYVAPPGSWLDRLQKEILEVSVLRMKGPVLHRLNRYRKRAGLGPMLAHRESYPELAHITQWPQCFDLVRSELPRKFFYAGPFVDAAARVCVDFPWGRLDGRPLIYASLGTTRKGDPDLFQRISAACADLDVQLVISLGGRRDPGAFSNLPGNPVVVGNAPQLELLKRAEVVITHAGPNTVLESIMQGKPMVALPMLLDQPAVALRLECAGAGVTLSKENRSVQKIRTALIEVRSNPRYREAAEGLQAQIYSAHGLKRAADIIEDSLTKYVLTSDDKRVTTFAGEHG